MILRYDMEKQSNAAVLGCNMSYDAMLAIEGLILINPKLDVIRKAGNKPNKTNLVKMALMYFFTSTLTKEQLLKLYALSENDVMFQQTIVGESEENE